jgi:hypothetical protein
MKLRITSLSVSTFCVVALAASLAGCKSAPNTPQPSAEARPILPVVPDLTGLSDEQVVAKFKTSGLGFALRIPAPSYNSSEIIPLHVLFKDFEAKTPIASGMCGSLALHWQSTTSANSGTSGLNVNSRCFAGDPYPDSIPLEKGKLKILDVTVQGAHASLQPGQYLVTLTWQAYPAADLKSVASPEDRVAYATLETNPVALTVTPSGDTDRIDRKAWTAK